MRPVTVKKSGKIDGIKGLYKDLATGRFYVRKLVNGRDLTRTVQVGENAPFSVLERAAKRALNALVADHKGETPCSTQPAPKSRFKSILEAFELHYASRVAPKTAQRYRRHLQGFLLCSNEKFSPEVDQANIDLIRERVNAASPTIGREIHKMVGAVYKFFIANRIHLGHNPVLAVKKPASIQVKDTRYLTMEQMVQVRQLLTGEERWFYDLLCLGMRPSSAILIKPSDIHSEDTKSWLIVNNHKTGRMTNIKQPVPANFLVDICNFTLKNNNITNRVSKKIKEISPDCSAKHLRKSFITNLVMSGSFSVDEVKILTHAVQDIATDFYFCECDALAEKIMRKFEELWIDAEIELVTR